VADYEPDEALVEVVAIEMWQADLVARFGWAPHAREDFGRVNTHHYREAARAVLSAVGSTLLARGYEQGADDEADAWYRTHDDDDVEHAKNPYLGGAA